MQILISLREFHGVWGDFDVNITIDKNILWEVQVIYKIKTKLDTDTKTPVLT
jgi:hypothetical protein